MTPYEVYIDYLALKRHFTTESYDYHKYNGKVRANKDSFEKRKDKFFFEKISRHRDPHGLMLANFITTNPIWVRSLTSDDALEHYNKWIAKTQSITRFVENDLANIDENFDSNFKIEDGKHPKLLKLFLAEKISIETFIILIDISKCKSYWDNKLGDDYIWLDVKRKLKKISQFIEYDKKKIKKIILEKFHNEFE
jgi:hypothetical protein